ncbi:MAG: MoxR family ATPase [Kiritimatiellae bacterium]|jgi:MoxR-like ATPase|nr:MoxR family ATPase [Kiritimatiellia bacterium]MDD4341933.1 MoxR family ATPase [Kiritimatiellia bacterium]MDY0150094.1 MoxR family ATPase [Kiritimatiellia bacterium]
MSDSGITAINDKVKQESAFIAPLRAELEKVIIGQRYLLDRLMIGLLANGHLLLEGVPGLAKTLAVKTLAAAIHTDFQRIQFTPDLLPADLVGTQVYNPKTGDFGTRKGPVFANLILADEINRAPAKVQSALLEAMQERQVTIGHETFPLPDPFLVLATQNPIEQEGTYPLPEAQVDRFMLKLVIDYPTRDEERRILDANARTQVTMLTQAVTEPTAILSARKVIDHIYVDDKIKDYILSIVFATRDPNAAKLPALQRQIRYGASPRATLYLTIAARAHAFLQGRGYVTPQDVKSIAPDVLRHRIIPSFEAEAEEITADTLVTTLLNELPVP